MTTTMVGLLAILLSTLFVVFADVNVRIERHFPCSDQAGPPNGRVLIKFPSSRSPGVQFKEDPNSNGHTCFRLTGGRVQVFAPGLRGDKHYSVHLETRIGINGKPERCIHADANGCGGIGSCVHCDICKRTTNDLLNFVQIYKSNRQADCRAEGLAAGFHEDLSLRVCLPSKKELLPFFDQNANRAEQLWEFFVSSRARGGEIPLVIAARIFDRPINGLDSRALNDALHGSKTGMIGCHWLYATVSQQ